MELFSDIAEDCVLTSEVVLETATETSSPLSSEVFSEAVIETSSPLSSEVFSKAVIETSGGGIEANSVSGFEILVILFLFLIFAIVLVIFYMMFSKY
uniref:Uncharacterized protein n=1 Tax=Caenorhabditis tropicalis TaxID=1561998 RepID=A0A1I7TX96_9PELO